LLRRRLFLTGTPILNRPKEIFPLLTFSQVGDEFLWKAPINEQTAASIPTSATLLTGIPRWTATDGSVGE
jgi:hypothetical protein